MFFHFLLNNIHLFHLLQARRLINIFTQHFFHRIKFSQLFHYFFLLHMNLFLKDNRIHFHPYLHIFFLFLLYNNRHHLLLQDPFHLNSKFILHLSHYIKFFKLPHRVFLLSIFKFLTGIQKYYLLYLHIISLFLLNNILVYPHLKVLHFLFIKEYLYHHHRFL
mmetsp:Transcript_15188/g.1361  ORF Transcript_15188/g.1361 Transcript_15188/m.1361 type:complete len:163 (-) Transcript_15188:105-593(-)